MFIYRTYKGAKIGNFRETKKQNANPAKQCNHNYVYFEGNNNYFQFLCIFANNKTRKMEFELIKKGPISDEEIIDEIKAVMKKLGKSSITIKEFDANAKINSTTVANHFGSWNNALIKAGAEINKKNHLHEEMMNNIRDAWIIKGMQPSKRDMDNKELSSISSGSYIRHYGTWYKALECFISYISEKDVDASIEIQETASSVIKHKTKRDPSDRLKVQVLMRDGNRCRICGVECSGGLHNIHFDHIKPWSKGGETTLENLRVLCSHCNEALGNSEN